MTLEENDNDPHALFTRIVEELADVTDLALGAVSVAGLIPRQYATVAAARLRRLLSAIATPFVLVLDDTHVVESETAVDLLEVLVADVPFGSELVVIGRGPRLASIIRRQSDTDVREITWHAGACLVHGSLSWMEGDSETATTMLTQAAAEARAADAPSVEAMARARLALVHLTQGELSDARRHANDARDDQRAQLLDEMPTLHIVPAVTALLAVMGGAPDLAQAEARLSRRNLSYFDGVAPRSTSAGPGTTATSSATPPPSSTASHEPTLDRTLVRCRRGDTAADSTHRATDDHAQALAHRRMNARIMREPTATACRARRQGSRCSTVVTRSML